MIVHPTIYKRTSSGKVQIWFMESDGDRYRTTSGQRGGKKVTSEWTVAKPKNEGKANATTAEEQALAEVSYAYTNKLDRDYRRELDSIDVETRIKPMLATKWADRKNKIPAMVHMQPKLDGMRCIASKSGLWSREGKPILGAPHIHEGLAEVFALYPNLVIDGELYNHELKDDFNKIISCAKKQTPTEKELQISRENIQYWMYDLASSDRTFTSRNEELVSIYFDHFEAHEHYVCVPTVAVLAEEVDDYASTWIELGYEGAMVRLMESLYENKRSNGLIKWKEFQDDEFLIADILDGDGNRAGMAAKVILSLPDGRPFGAGMIGNLEYCKQLLINKNKYIGQMGTVVFQNYTPDGIPRFAKFKTVRDYE